MSETILIGGPNDGSTAKLPDATRGRCEDCSCSIVYRGLAPANWATVCVDCAAKRVVADPTIVAMGPSQALRMTFRDRRFSA